MPQPSTSNSIPPREVTASTMLRQSYFLASSQSALASLRTPVDVSACTKARILISGLALRVSSTTLRSVCSPHVLLTVIASPPQRSTFSTMRLPNTPLIHTSTLSPGSTRLTKHASIPAEPGAEIGIVSAFSVLNAYCKSCLVWSINSMNNGSRWPKVGLAMAFKILGLTSDGPGPIKVRSGGIKVENDCIIHPRINVRACF